MISILIVEDSLRDAQLYQKALAAQKELQLFHVTNGEDAFALLSEQPVDVFFLDVELPGGMSGFDVARKLRTISAYALAPIVFITGYSKNPLEAFRRFHCYDFIEKPFSMKAFSDKVSELVDQLKAQSGRTRMEASHLCAFSTSKGVLYLCADEILFAEADRNHCILTAQQGVFRLSGTSLHDVIATIDDPNFLRCHKSFAVNVKYIKEFRKVNYRLFHIILFHSHAVIDMSSTYSKAVLERLNQRSCIAV